MFYLLAIHNMDFKDNGSIYTLFGKSKLKDENIMERNEERWKPVQKK